LKYLQNKMRNLGYVAPGRKGGADFDCDFDADPDLDSQGGAVGIGFRDRVSRFEVKFGSHAAAPAGCPPQCRLPLAVRRRESRAHLETAGASMDQKGGDRLRVAP